MLLRLRSKVEAMGAWVRYEALWVLLEERSSHRKEGGNKKYLEGDPRGRGWHKP